MASGTEPATAEEVVALKLVQFARGRHELVRAMAERAHLKVPPEVDAFFAAVEAGDFQETDRLFKELQRMRRNGPESAALTKVSAPLLETYGVAEVVHTWPARQLLDYGHSILDTLQSGMVYVGGTDSGRFIPTLLNETAVGERHVVLTQNALADVSYLDYLNFQHEGRLNTLSRQDSERAFQEYIEDAKLRLAHDRDFPDEPSQLRPGEQVREVDGRIEVSGQTAVMSINERLLQTLMEKNSEVAFGLEESIPMKSTYGAAAPLGPITEVRAPGGEAQLTSERATAAANYWTGESERLRADPEAASSHEVMASNSKLAVAQANLLAERNFPAEAEKAYRAATEMLPSNLEAVGGLAELLSATGRPGEAERLVTAFMRDNPKLGSDLDLLRRQIQFDRRAPKSSP